LGIFTLNLLRLSFIAVAAEKSPALFKFVHQYLWQATFIVVVLLLWGLWVEYSADKK
jgi:exosortase/archaeosortase family protein